MFNKHLNMFNHMRSIVSYQNIQIYNYSILNRMNPSYVVSCKKLSV